MSNTPFQRIYAIGDIHGRPDLLAQLLGIIGNDSKNCSGAWRCIFLGDYIDRGYGSKRALEIVQELSQNGQHIALRGNHEENFSMLQYKSMTAVDLWLQEYNGGKATLKNFGISPPTSSNDINELTRVQKNMREMIPTTTIKFINDMPTSYSWGGYFFSHAGIDPMMPLERQNPSVLLWGTSAFQDIAHPSGTVCVHGHWERGNAVPEVRPHRINVDTAAWLTGNLTAVALEHGCAPRFLGTDPR